MIRTIAALFLFACGGEIIAEPFVDESAFPEYARGIELLAEQGIFVPPFRAKFVDGPIERPNSGRVGGYVESYAPNVVVVVSKPCIGETSFLHELTHLALYAEGFRDSDHKLKPYWNAVRTANAIWRAEICE